MRYPRCGSETVPSLRFLSVAVLVLSYNRTRTLAKVKRVTYAKNQHSFLCCLPDGCNRYKNVRPADRSGERKLRQDGGTLPRQVRVCAAERSNESPSGAFKRQNGLAPARWRGLAPTSSAHDAQNADNAKKNTAFPPVCKKCAKVCRAPEKGKSHEESCDSSWDFGALEGTRIPGPLIKRAPRAGYSDFETFEFTLFLRKAS